MNVIPNPTFIAIDTATTGLDPARDYLLEVGWQLVVEGKLRGDPESAFIHQGQAEAYYATVPHNYATDATLVRWRAGEHVRLFEVMKRIYVTTAASPIRPALCFHNAPFDMSFLTTQTMLEAESAAFFFEEARGPFSRRMIDTQAIALYHHLRGNCESCALGKLCAHFDIMNEAPHTAGGDARVTVQLALAMLREGL